MKGKVMYFWRKWLQHNAKFIIKWLQKYLPQEPKVALITFTTTEGVVTLAEITVSDDTGGLAASVSFKDVHGHDTPAQDVPAWTSSDENVVALATSEDGLSATATIIGPGASLIQVTSFTDDGDEITAQGTITVTPGEPSSSEVTFAPLEGNGGETEPPVEEPPA
jgi:hypothetical protein